MSYEVKLWCSPRSFSTSDVLLVSEALIVTLVYILSFFSIQIFLTSSSGRFITTKVRLLAENLLAITCIFVGPSLIWSAFPAAFNQQCLLFFIFSCYLTTSFNVSKGSWLWELLDHIKFHFMSAYFYFIYVYVYIHVCICIYACMYLLYQKQW